jgi:hypothetical protein
MYINEYAPVSAGAFSRLFMVISTAFSISGKVFCIKREKKPKKRLHGLDKA